jgi:hypothetical protein
MTTPPPYSDTGEDTVTGVDPPAEPTTGAPRWVKVFGIIVLGLAVLFVGLKLTGIGPNHGPGRHGGGGGTPATSVSETGGHTSPPGMNHN